MYMRSAYGRLNICLIILLFVISACNRPASTPTIEPEAILVYTAAAQTVEAQFTNAAEGAGQQATLAPIPLLPTETPVPPTDEVPQEKTPEPTDSGEVTKEPGEEVPCDRATFVSDVSIPDGTEILGGESYEKTWRLRNNGTCTWNSGYALVFESGDAMSGPASIPLTTGTVAPDEELDITIQLTAPEDSGTYRGNWKLRNSSGIVFGLGEDAESVFWVEIVVPAPTETPDPGFILAYELTHDCDGVPTLVLRLENTGNVNLESTELTLVNVDDGNAQLVNTTSNAPFMGQPSECPPGGDTMAPGKTFFVGAKAASLPASGTNLRAIVKLCSGNDLGGACTEKSVDFPAP
jgi:hypothetical protein